MPDEAALKGCKVWPDTWRNALPPWRSATDVLSHASRLVAGDRNRTHGDKLDNHRNIAAMWNAYLGDQLARPITPAQVALMMAALKIARTKIGDHNIDDYIDGAGYFACAAEVKERSE